MKTAEDIAKWAYEGGKHNRLYSEDDAIKEIAKAIKGYANQKNNSRLDDVSGLDWISANGEYRANLNYGFATITRIGKKWHLKTPKVSGFFDEPENAKYCAYEHHRDDR